MSKVAFVCSGGAQNGSYAVGVLKRLLLELDIVVSIYAGVSVGALIGALMAQYPEGRKIEGYTRLVEIFSTVKTDDIHTSWAWRWLGRWFGYLWAVLTGKPSLRTTAPLRSLMERHFDPRAFKESDKQLLVGAISYTSGEYKVLDQDFVPLIKAIEASASFPLLFEPVRVRNELWADGGVRTVTPLKAAIDAGAEVIYSVTLAPEKNPSWGEEDPNILDVGLRAFALQGEEVILTDLQLAKMYNAAILLVERLKEAGVSKEDITATLAQAGLPTDLRDKRYVEIIEFRPEKPFSTALQEFIPAEARQLQEMGYQDAVVATGG